MDHIFKKQTVIGRGLSFVAVAFLAFDSAIKFFMDKLPPEALEAGAALQWPIEKMPLVGLILSSCLALHLIPRTAIVGAILLTGYLGGAVASHVRVGNPIFSHTLSPVYVGAFIWLGLYLRDPRLNRILK
ncbi:DoxX family protein [bacterium]|nr:DoxX family protein [bacterium]